MKIWNRLGTIVWSDERSLIGDVYNLSPEAESVLASGSTSGEVTDLREPENVYEVKDDGLLPTGSS